MTDKPLDERHPPKYFQVHAAQDERSGGWTATCPFCAEELRGMLFSQVESAIFAHLNARHDRRGH